MSKIKRYLSGVVIVLSSILLLLSVAFADDRFEDNKNGTVSDSKTRLIWQQQDDGKRREWNDAMDYCKKLSLAGQKDWRLPNVDELATIVEPAKKSPAIDKTYFPDTQPSTYWSASASALYQTFVWAVDFSNGVHGNSNKNYLFYARCVRP